MFGVDWNNPETFWLNVINLMLGIVTLACVGALAYGLAGEVWERVRRRARVAGMDAELRDLHAMHLPELGLTMADGGEPVEPAPPAPAPKRQRRTRRPPQA